MKRLTYITIILITAGVLGAGRGWAQTGECLGGGCPAGGSQYPASTLTPTTSWQTQGSIWAGEWQRFSVTSGNIYEFSLCTADGGSCSYDGQLTLYNDANTILCYSDDYCNTDDPKIIWTATYTGFARTRVNLYNCTTNSTATTLAYKYTAPACTQPTTQATINAYTNNTTGTTLTVNWTRGNGTAGVIVVARLTATANVNPASGTSYAANAAFGSGATTGAGNFVVYNGTGTTVNVTALTAGTSYTFIVYEYNTTGTCYKIAGSSSAVTTGYCAANGTTCDEYIGRVQVGSIDNSTACTGGGYANYTAQSTSMNIGTGYPITVTNGPPNYSGDQCGIWVDWNQDGDFADASETMTVTGTPGNGPYTATITPPGAALTGNTRMRVRIHWSDEATSSCGSATYGEVEDYTVNVVAACASTITLAANAPAAANICASTLKVPIQSFSLAVTVCDGNLTNVGFTTTGTYVVGDISKYQLWYRATTNNISGAAQLGVDLASAGGAGARSFAAFASPTLTSGTTYYFWITVDVAASPTNNNTIACNATTTANLTSTSTKAGSTAAGGTQTLKASPTASNAGSAQSNCNSGSFTLAGNSPTVGTGLWTCTAGCAGVSITTPAANNSGVTGVVAGTPATLTWTISNSPCAASASNVILTNNAYPTTQATINAYTNNTTGTTLTVNWTRGNGATGVIVVARLTATANVNPSNGTTYAANAAFGSGATTGAGNFVVYNGTGTTVNVTALTANTSYTFIVYEYSGLCYMVAGSSSAVTTPVVYCTSTSTSGSSYFNAFSTTGGITNITNSASGYSAGGYGNFTAQSVSQAQISSINFNTTLIGTTVGVNIWVDWNQDGDFVDAGENVYWSGASYVSAASGSFAVPATATLGNTRMRIRMDYNSTNPAICGSITRGETEDYTFTVVVPCTPPAVVTVAPASTTQCGGTVSLTASGGAGGTIYWQNTTSGGTSTADPANPKVVSASGTYYFRSYNSASGGCWGTQGSAAVTINSAPSITGQPGNASVAAGAGSANFTVTATGAGLNYQWQEYISSWINVSNGGVYSGATSATLTITNPPYGMNGYKYRCIVGGTCAPNVTSDGLATLTVTYCTPTYSLGCNNTVDVVTRVRFNTLDNTTTWGTTCPTRYVDYTGSVAAPNVVKSTLYNLLITVGNDAGNYTAAWFDWNRDGDFADAGEYFNGGNPGANGTATIPVTIPAGATLGITRMRVRGGEDSDINSQSHACDASPSGYGEAEDYIIDITAPCTPPTTQASAFTSSAIANTTMTIGWTRGNGNNVMVIAKAGSAPSDPTNGTPYTANVAYGSGTAVGGGFCVYNGTGTSVNLTALTQNTMYYFAIYEYATAGTCYNLTQLTGNTQTANDGGNVTHPGDGGSATYYMCSGNYYDPGGSGSDYASDITISTTTFYPSSGSKVSVTFSSFSTENNYDGLMIYDGPSSGSPLISSGLGAGTNATTCPAGSWRGTGTPGTVTSTHATGALTFVFRSDGSVTSSGWAASIACISSCTPPATQATSFNTNTITATSMNYAFTRGNGTGGVLVIAKAGSAPTDPMSGTSYTASAVYGSGTAVGGGFCVYKGTAAGTGNPTGNIAITGLSCLTTYYFAVYEYNTVGTCFNLTELTGSAATVPPGDQTTYGAGSWIGYVYSWSGSPDFSPINYKGYVTQATSFDRNPADVASGGNICGGPYTDNLSIRYKMNYNFAAGNYVFTIGGDDGIRLSVDGGSTWIIDGWSDHGYTTYSNNPCVILSGSTNLILEYYENASGSRVSFSYTTVGGSCYCAANGSTCDEYISNVTVGSINNSTACTSSPQGYADYTAQSTTMNIGSGYAISVSNGNPYSTDQCGIWVDWSKDGDFGDANETITVTGTPGNGPYTATITPPSGAVVGTTRMRVRIMYTGTVSSCGSTTYGEVEDYAIIVAGCVAPTSSASALNFPSVQCTQMNVAWTSGNGGKRIVVAKAGSAVGGNPVDGTDYAENSSFGSGGTIAAGEFVVYDGTGASFTLTNLTAGTTYYLKVFEYNCAGANIKYRTTSPPSANQATNSVPGAPSVISGSQGVCIYQTGVSYSVTIAGATTYTWAYTGSGLTNTSGNVNPLVADFSATATSGNLTVYGTSSCGNGPTSAALAITVNTTPPSSVDAGEDQYICPAGTSLSATGSGTWSILNGTGSITTPSSPTSAVTVTNPNTAVTFRWTSSNGCGSSTDEVVITRGP